MIRAKKVAKRGLSLLLTLAMLLSVVSFQAFAEEPATVAKSDLLIKQYGTELTAEEQAVVKELVEGTYSYTLPNAQNGDGLIVITDKATTNPKIEAKTEGVWVPVSATVKVDGEEAPRTLTLDADGKAEFTNEELKPYAVTVTYRYAETISAEEAAAVAAAFRAPAQLKNGLDQMKFLNDYVVDSLNELAGYLPTLHEYDPELDGNIIIINNEVFNEAVRTLYAQYEANGGYLNLPILLANGQTEENGKPMPDVSLANLLANGGEIYASTADTLDIISNWLGSKVWSDERLMKFDAMESAYTVLNNLVNNLKKAADAAFAPEADVVALFEGKDLSKLEPLIKAVSAEQKSFEIGTSLTVAEQLVTANVGQTAVLVKIEAKVINGKNELVAAEPAFEPGEVTLPVGATKAQIEAAIEEAGFEATALGQWEENFQVNETNYDKTVSELPETLGEETVTYTVSYEPKDLDVTIAGKTDQYPYGWTLTLPECETEGRAYDYMVDGVAYFQGETIRVTKALNITRTEGPAYQVLQLDELAAKATNTGLDDNAKAILNNPAVVTKSVKLRVPEGDLAKGEFKDGVCTVTAQPYNASIAGKSWLPTVAKIDGVEDAVFAEGANSVTLSRIDFELATVDYVLALPDSALGNGIATVIALPATLKAEAEAQKAGLAKLTATDIMDDLGSLNKEKLQKLRTGVVNFVHDEAIVKGVMAIIDECVAPNDSLILYNYLNTYSEQGLAYYYQFSGNINDQISKLTVNLKPILDNKDGFKKDLIDSHELTAEQIDDYLNRFDRIYAALTAADNALKSTPINAAINTADPALSNLVAALEKDVVTGTAPTELELTQEVPVDVEGRYILTVTVENSVTGAKATKRYVVGVEETVPAADVNAWIESVAADYEDADLFTQTGDKVPTALTANTSITVTYKPTQFQVKLNGADWEGVKVALGSLSIELPKHEKAPSFRYDYKVNGKEIQGETATFTKDDLRNGTLDVTREEINVAEHELIDVIDKLNKGIVENGMTASVGSAETGVATFILDETDGHKSLVLRLTPSKNLNRKAVFSSIANTISETGLYVGIEGKPFWDPKSENGSLYPQTAVDMMLNSGFGMKTILDVIDADGHIVEMNPSKLGKANARVADSTEAVINDYAIYAEDTLGGLLIKTTVQIGLSSGATEDLTFYVTIEDFGARTDTLKALRKNVNRLYQYIDAQLIDGTARLTLKDGPAYKAYITVAAASGYSDISDIYNIDANGMAEFAFKVIDQLIQDENINLETYTNTLGEVIDLSDYDGQIDRAGNYYEYAKKAYAKLIDHSTLNDKPAKGDNPSVWALTTDVVDILRDQHRISQDRVDQIEAVLAEESIDYAVALQIPDVEYVAVVVVPETNKRNKISFPKDGELSAVLAENNEDAVVILLSDCTEVVEINKNVALDLNGKKLAGIKVSASSNHAVIVDSTLDNRGQVGTVEGTSALKITGGTFPTADITAYLPNDYVKDSNNIVRNKLYFLTVDDTDNTITVNLDPDRITLYGIPSVKALAVELAFDLGINYYGAASMTVNGNELYGTDFDNDRVTDLIDWLINITEEDANEVIDYFHMDGINAFIAEVIGVATNFTNIAANSDSTGTLATFDYTYNTWGFDVHRCERRNELDFDVLANELNSKSGKIVIKFADSDAEYNLAKYANANDEIKDLAQHLADVTTLNTVGLTLDKPTYHNKTLTLQGTGKTDVVFDLRDDPSYALAFGVIFAAGIEDTEKIDALKNGINSYYASGSMKTLKAAIESLSNTEALEAFAQLRRADGEDVFETLVEKAGLTGVIDDHTIELARTYRAWLVSIGTADRISGITGGGKEIGAYETEYGVYEIEKTGSVNRSKTIKRWTVDGTGIVETGHMTLKLFRQTPVIYTIQDVDTTGDILAWKVIDSYPDKAQSVSTAAGTDGILYIDLITDKEIDFFPCVGFITPDDLKAALTDVLYDGDVLEMEIEGAVTDEYTGTTEVVPTGAKVTLRAWYNDDPNNIVEAVYYIVNLGDTNCNGFTDSGDAVLIKDHYEKEGGVLSGYALLAGNVNQQGDGEPGDLSIDGIDSGDAVRVKIKYENPSKYPPSALN